MTAPVIAESIGFATQSTDSMLDYEIDWSKWLPVGDTILSSTFTCDDGLILTLESSTPTSTAVWVSGGESRNSYDIVNEVTTSAGRVDSRSFTVAIR